MDEIKQKAPTTPHKMQREWPQVAVPQIAAYEEIILAFERCDYFFMNVAPSDKNVIPKVIWFVYERWEDRGLITRDMQWCDYDKDLLHKYAHKCVTDLSACSGVSEKRTPAHLR